MLLVLVVSVGQVGAAEPDLEYGAHLAESCTACHSDGAQGIPTIVGLEPAALIAMLEAYADGTRDHPGMRVVAAGLGEPERAALGAYLATVE